MELRLTHTTVQFSVTVLMSCFALQIVFSAVCVAGQMDWADDDDDPGKSQAHTFIIPSFIYPYLGCCHRYFVQFYCVRMRRGSVTMWTQDRLDSFKLYYPPSYVHVRGILCFLFFAISAVERYYRQFFRYWKHIVISICFLHYIIGCVVRCRDSHCRMRICRDRNKSYDVQPTEFAIRNNDAFARNNFESNRFSVRQCVTAERKEIIRFVSQRIVLSE